MNIAIIPARGGSKRVPLKNIREFAGIPMLTRTIKTLHNSECFDQIIVSTDSEDIANIASKSEKCEIHWRDPILAEDNANTVDVIDHVINSIGIVSNSNICCVYAPNPFLLPSAIQLGLRILESNDDADYVSPVTTFPFPIQRSLSFQDSEKLISMTWPEHLLSHSQSLSPNFHETAQFWWAKGATWASRRPMQLNMVGIYTPRWMCQDIDTFEDWKQAEIRWEILNRDGTLENYKFTEENILTRHGYFE